MPRVWFSEAGRSSSASVRGWHPGIGRQGIGFGERPGHGVGYPAGQHGCRILLCERFPGNLGPADCQTVWADGRPGGGVVATGERQLSDGCHATCVGPVRSRAFPADANLDRHGNHFDQSSLGGACGLLVRLAAGRGLLHPGTSAGGRAATGSRARSRRASAGAGEPGDREDRAELEVRHRRLAGGGNSRSRHGVRYHGGRLSVGSGRTESQPGRFGQASSGSHDDQDQGTDRDRKIAEADGSGSRAFDHGIRGGRRGASRAAGGDPAGTAKRRRVSDPIRRLGNAVDRRAGRDGIQRHQGKSTEIGKPGRTLCSSWKQRFTS